MSSANDVAAELQAKYDYFFAAAILASLGFSVQITVVHDKLSVIFYTVGLVAFAISATFCFYRLQQKPLIYQLHSKADDARESNRFQAMKNAEEQAKLLESKYEFAYWVMCITFALGALSIGISKLATLYISIFTL